MGRIKIGNVIGPVGPIGPEGKQGIQGPMGPQGPVSPLRNNLTATEAGVEALDAVQGRVLEEKLNDSLNKLNEDLNGIPDLYEDTIKLNEKVKDTNDHLEEILGKLEGDTAANLATDIIELKEDIANVHMDAWCYSAGVATKTWFPLITFSLSNGGVVHGSFDFTYNRSTTTPVRFNGRASIHLWQSGGVLNPTASYIIIESIDKYLNFDENRFFLTATTDSEVSTTLNCTLWGMTDNTYSSVILRNLNRFYIGDPNSNRILKTHKHTSVSTGQTALPTHTNILYPVLSEAMPKKGVCRVASSTVGSYAKVAEWTMSSDKLFSFQVAINANNIAPSGGILVFKLYQSSGAITNAGLLWQAYGAAGVNGITEDAFTLLCTSNGTIVNCELYWKIAAANNSFAWSILQSSSLSSLAEGDINFYSGILETISELPAADYSYTSYSAPGRARVTLIEDPEWIPDDVGLLTRESTDFYFHSSWVAANIPQLPAHYLKGNLFCIAPASSTSSYLFIGYSSAGNRYVNIRWDNNVITSVFSDVLTPIPLTDTVQPNAATLAE